MVQQGYVEIDSSGFLGCVFSSVIHRVPLFVIRWVPGDRLFALSIFSFTNLLHKLYEPYAGAFAINFFLDFTERKAAVVWGMGGLIAIGFHPILLLLLFLCYLGSSLEVGFWLSSLG